MIEDLSDIKKIYFIGIKGVAMTGLAVICKQRGLEVFGSDVAEKFITDKILDQEGIEFFENFSADNLKLEPDLVVLGTSWGDDHIEVQEANLRSIPMISDSELRGLLSREKKTVAVTGVHGKTTTTAMLAYVFSQAGLDPSFLIGTGQIPDLQANAAWSEGQHFIVEGDEYIRSQTDKTPKFLDLDPNISIITSLEWEHVDIFPNVEAMEEVFQKLIKKTEDLVVACGDWPSIKKIIQGFVDKTVTYGLESGNVWQAYDIKQEFERTKFKIKRQAEKMGEFEIKLFGPHNVLNALATIIVSFHEGIELAQIASLLANFQGTERRFDVSARNGITFIDDYAHHPTEIKQTLKAIRHRYAKKEIWCVFQPHMASRTKALLTAMAQSFNDVDHAIFADIFSSAREKDEDITSKHLEQEAKKFHNNAIYIGDLDQTIDYLKDKVKPGMVLVTMGAGDVYRVRDKLISEHI